MRIIMEKHPFDFLLKFMGTECLRCSLPFVTGESVVLVRGNQHAKYRQIGLIVHEGCIQEDYDLVLNKTPLHQASAVHKPYWPLYVGGGGARFTWLCEGAAS